jgi:hypothetical protein
MSHCSIYNSFSMARQSFSMLSNKLKTSTTSMACMSLIVDPKTPCPTEIVASGLERGAFERLSGA